MYVLASGFGQILRMIQLKSYLFLFLFNLMLKPTVSTMNFTFDVATLPSGVILERADNVLLGSGQITFPLLVKVHFPVLNISADPDCEMDPASFRIWDSVHIAIVQEISDHMFEIIGGNFTKQEIKHLVSRLLLDNKQEMGGIPRKKRSFEYLRDGYLFHSSWTEDKFKSMTEWSESQFDALNQRVTANGISMNMTLSSLKAIERDLCTSMTENWQNAIENLRLSLILSIENFLEVIEQVKNGFLPNIISDKFVQDFCNKHFKPYPESKFCSEVNVRNLFRVSLKEVIKGPEDSPMMGIKMSVTVVSTDIKPHKIFRLRYIPIFSNNNHSAQVGTSRLGISRRILKNPIRFIAVQTTPFSDTFESIVGYEQVGCIDNTNYHICTERASSSDEICLQSLIYSQALNSECQVENKIGHIDCVSRKMDSGTVVSSLKSIKIHSHNTINSKDQIFKLKDRTRKGIFFIPNHKNLFHIFSCSDRQVKIEPKQSIDMVIIEKRLGNITLDLSPVAPKSIKNVVALENQIKKNEKIDKILSRKLTRLNQFSNVHFGVTIYQTIKSTSLSLGSFLILLLIGYIIWKIFKCISLRKLSKRQVTLA